jgi:hypothetical protein
MKLTFTIAFVLSVICACAQQQKEFLLQGHLVDEFQNPIPDAYIINLRNHDKSTSRNNGVFDMRVLSGVSLVISHVSYFRKIVPVFRIMADPTIVLMPDTINILQIDISPNRKTEAERAADNIQRITFDPRPQPGDNYTESERAQNLLDKNNRIERSRASSLNYQFSPSEIIGKLIDKRKQRKKSKEFDSTKKK